MENSLFSTVNFSGTRSGVDYIPYSTQCIEDDDIEQVVQALRSSYLSQGPRVDQFEEELKRVTGARHAITVSSGTAALHCAMVAMLSTSASKIVWTSPLSFVASSNAPLASGASIDFVDVDPSSGNISIGSLSEKLVAAERTGKLPSILIPVHFAGSSCDMQALQQLAARYHFKIMEDAAHGLGGYHADGSAIGSCKFSSATALSFHAVKSITTGEGGAVLTNDNAIAQICALFRTHGITRDPQRFQRPVPVSHHYEQSLLGFNYRLTDIQCALGVSQLAKLPRFISRRREIAEAYMSKLADLEIDLPPFDPLSAWHLFPIRLEQRDTVFTKLRERKIGVNVHYPCIAGQPYYRELGFKSEDFPNAKRYSESVLSIPIHPKLSNEQLERVVQELRTVLAEVRKLQQSLPVLAKAKPEGGGRA